MLVATDAVRMPGNQIYIAYDFPADWDGYAQWMGRKGRFGRNGVSVVSLVTQSEVDGMKEVSRILKIQMTELLLNFKE